MTPLHVCFLCDEYPPRPHGGIGSFTRALARALAAAGHAVSVVGIYTGMTAATTEDDEGVRVVRLPHSRIRFTGLAVNAWRLRRALASIHRERPIDVIEGPEIAFARLPLRSPSVRIIRMNGGHHFFATTLGGRPLFPRRWLERRSFRRADFLCAVSRYVGETTRGLLGLGARPIEILPNPVETAVFEARGPQAEDPRSILFVGTLCEKKGIRQLVAAMPDIAAAVPGARLDVIGPDRVDGRTGESFRERLEASIPPALRDRIVFHGRLDNRLVPDRIAAAAVCVYPSHMEACPVAWLEAMAMRKAIVASRTGPGPELIEDGVSGLLCDPHDPRSIAASVVSLLNDPEKRERLAAAAHQRALDTFAIDTVVERNVAFYRDCVERHRAGGHAAVQAPARLRKLLVVSHVVHYDHDGRLHAYAPYAREIDKWAEIFPELLIAAPCRRSAPPADCEPLTAANIAMRPQLERGGDSLAAKIRLAVSLPRLVAGLGRAMREADAIHVRCPGNLGLLGAALAPVFSRYLIAKYAGQWSGYAGEPLSSRVQRWLLRSPWWGSAVLVYGDQPGQPAHIVPFFTSALTSSQVRRARAAAARRVPLASPMRILYVGRLSAAKNVQVLVDAIANLTRNGDEVRCTIVGEGPERAALERQLDREGLRGRVELAGGMPLDGVLDYYERADVLVLASQTEGWPKAIVEAMTFGLVCVGSNRGLVPWILGEGRGIVVPPGDVAPLTAALTDICRRPAQYRLMAGRAAAWGQQDLARILRGRAARPAREPVARGRRSRVGSLMSA